MGRRLQNKVFIDAMQPYSAFDFSLQNLDIIQGWVLFAKCQSSSVFFPHAKALFKGHLTMT